MAINYKYINKSLELFSGVPATILIYWFPIVIVTNITMIIVAIIFTILDIWLYRNNYGIIEIKEIFLYITRKPITRIFPDED